MDRRDILAEIVEHKKEEVARAKRILPESRLKSKATLERGPRHFFRRLASPGPTGVNIIAEVKRASPSKGVFSRSLEADDMARVYESGGAAALSILTDEKYFLGSADDLKAARQATSLPVLRKDFLISSYQLYESACLGADAVLLIVRILAESQLADYLELAKELRMDALVEVHSLDDLAIAQKAGARLIGINNRNLRSFDTSIDTAIQMVPQLMPGQVPVAASGIKSPADIDRNLKAKIHNFLIGESLVKAPDTQAFMKRLLSAGKTE